MSSTNRGAERQPDDFYETPAWCTRAILPHLAEPKCILDPAAGRGAMLVVARERWPAAKRFGVEIDPKRQADCHDRIDYCYREDALAHENFTPDFMAKRFDLILANPPFKLALGFVEKSCKYIEKQQCGQAAFLLRLAFLETKERNQFLRNRMPDNIYVLPRRPAFIKGKTDSCAYAWFVWGPERRNESKLSVLEVTK